MKTTKNKNARTSLPAHADSISQAAGILTEHGIECTPHQLRKMKAAGCPAFRSTRVYLAELLDWVANQRGGAILGGHAKIGANNNRGIPNHSFVQLILAQRMTRNVLRKVRIITTQLDFSGDEADELRKLCRASIRQELQLGVSGMLRAAAGKTLAEIDEENQEATDAWKLSEDEEPEQA